MIQESEWKQVEGPGHFIAAQHCSFIRHTHVGRYCVSTVGEYRVGGKPENPIESIGYGRLYETMVFPLDKNDQTQSWESLDFLGYNDDLDAERGHRELCLKFSNQD